MHKTWIVLLGIAITLVAFSTVWAETEPVEGRLIAVSRPPSQRLSFEIRGETLHDTWKILVTDNKPGGWGSINGSGFLVRRCMYNPYPGDDPYNPIPHDQVWTGTYEFHGSIAGSLPGSIVMHINATKKWGEGVNGHFTFLLGTGTDGLTGLHGNGTFSTVSGIRNLDYTGSIGWTGPPE
jgi:hypothetical protein